MTIDFDWNFVKDKEIEGEGDEPPCKGMIFRGKKSQWLADGFFNYHTRSSLNFLVRKSCKGCSQCDWLWESVGIFSVQDSVFRGVKPFYQGSGNYLPRL